MILSIRMAFVHSQSSHVSCRLGIQWEENQKPLTDSESAVLPVQSTSESPSSQLQFRVPEAAYDLYRLGELRIISLMNVPRNTYERWLGRSEQRGLEDNGGGGKPPWNRLTSPEIAQVLSAAREMPELSCRQLAAWTTGHMGFPVSESTVYRILRKEGLVKRPEMKAGCRQGVPPEDDGSPPDVGHRRFLLQGGGLGLLRAGHRDGQLLPLHPGPPAQAGHDLRLPHRGGAGGGGPDGHGPGPGGRPRTRLLSDNGPGYVSRAFRDYLRMVGIKHILAAPFHPQANGKLERYHRTVKRDVDQLPYELPSGLEAAIVAFVSYDNYRRYHKALGNVTPSDVLRGRRQEILQRRREVQAQTIKRRRQHNGILRVLIRPSSAP